MSTIVTRAGKGSPLTHNEVDANFTNLNTDKVEKTAAAITGGTINGTTIGATTPSSIVGTTITGQTGRVNGTGQNLALQSQTYTNATWVSSTATRADNQTTAPNGTTTAGTITTVNTTYGGLLRQSITTTTTTYTLSAYVKKNNWRYVGLRLGSLVGTSDRVAFFDFDTLATSTVGISGATFTATDAGSGWYRLALTGLLSSGTIFDIAITASDGSSQTNLGAGQIVNIWGVQLELGSTANTYIPTTTTAVYGTPTLSFSGVSEIGLQSNGALYLQPAGTGAIQAQATTSTTAGGNVRGAYAVDWQTNRGSAGNVASATNSVIGGGNFNTASGAQALVAGGSGNIASNSFSNASGGQSNTASGVYSTVNGGASNTVAGYFNYVGGGYVNSGTANAAVTTQSGTMNATTVVTLSGSNASIKVGQYITGTSISAHTYVAAISGTSLTLSQVAAGSSTSTLSFFTPHGVVVGGGNNQATGSYSFIGGGGDAGTAANRNVASGDWSFVGGGGRNTASGIGSVVCGGGWDGATLSGNTASAGATFIGSGLGNTASASYAMVLGGTINTSSATSSSVYGGSYGTTRAIVGNTVSSASFSPLGTFTTGNSQSALLVLGTQTTDATATILRSNTSVAGTTNQVILPNNSAYYFKGSVIANVTGAANGAAWSIEGAIMRGANAASTVLIDTPSVNRVAASAGATAWTIAVTADTTNGGIAVTVTGVAATTIRWVAKLETTEVTF